MSSASIRVDGAPNNAAILKMIRTDYCDSVLQADFTKLGVYRRARGVWIVLAQPFSAPSAEQSAQVSQDVLRLVNAARAQARRCGRTDYRAARALTLSPVLARAAAAHARDMAQHDFFEHRGSDGSQVADRVTRAGYRWRAVAENIAAGQSDARSVVDSWLSSPGHCANIMGAQYTQMGVAYVVDPKARSGVYWVQVFATPR